MRLRAFLQPAIDERGEQRAGAAAVGFLPFRQRGAQPHAIDHRGDHLREAARFLGWHQLSQSMAQIGQHAPLIDCLNTLQAAHVQHLTPEREPCGPHALVKFFRGEVRIDHRLDAATRGARKIEPRTHSLTEAASQRPESGFEQTVLVAEVMRDQPRRDVGAAGDLRKSAADVSDFGETIDRDFNELPPPNLFQLVARHRAARGVPCAVRGR